MPEPPIMGKTEADAEYRPIILSRLADICTSREEPRPQTLTLTFENGHALDVRAFVDEHGRPYVATRVRGPPS